MMTRMERPTAHDGFLLAAPSGDAPVAFTQERVGLARADGGLAQDPTLEGRFLAGGVARLVEAVQMVAFRVVPADDFPAPTRPARQ